MEFKVNTDIIDKYVNKYGLNHPDDFLLMGYHKDGSFSYSFDTTDLSQGIEKILANLKILIERRVRTKPSFEHFEELCFMVAYLDYYNRAGISRNQAVDAYYSNLRNLIKLSINLREKALPTEININFVEFKKNNYNEKYKANKLEPIEFEIFQNTPDHNFKSYLEFFAKLTKVNRFDDLFLKISDHNTSIDELHRLLGSKEIASSSHDKESLKYLYTALLIDFLETEMKLTRKAKVASSEEIEIIYFILSKIGVIADIHTTANSLDPLDNFRKDINRNL